MAKTSVNSLYDFRFVAFFPLDINTPLQITFPPSYPDNGPSFEITEASFSARAKAQIVHVRASHLSLRARC